jgi:CheY-like chemotaxis protein
MGVKRSTAPQEGRSLSYAKAVHESTGIEMTMTIPANQSTQRQAMTAPTPPAAPGHVLVVDDDPGIRGFIVMTLRAEGYSVAVGANGKQGLERLAEQQPDVILLDLSMPVMNGWEFQQQVRRMNLHIPIVFMTAGYSARAEAERCGAEGYLSKPFEVEDLIDIVGRFAPGVMS